MTKTTFYILLAVLVLILFLFYIGNRNYNQLGAEKQQLGWQLAQMRNNHNSR